MCGEAVFGESVPLVRAVPLQAVDKPTPENKQRVDLVLAKQDNLMM